MKNKAIVLAVLSALLTTIAPSVGATLYASNLDESWGGVSTVDREDWTASPFQTDNSASSFILDSIVLSLDGGAGTDKFYVALYEDDGNKPGASMYAVLTGNTNPETAGEYIYLPDGLVTLLPNTTYWVAAGVTSGSGEYDWNYTPAGITGQWTIPNLVSFYVDGDGWSEGLAFGPQQFSVSATAVPEPSLTALLIAGGTLAFTLARKRTRKT